MFKNADVFLGRRRRRITFCPIGFRRRTRHAIGAGLLIVTRRPPVTSDGERAIAFKRYRRETFAGVRMPCDWTIRNGLCSVGNCSSRFVTCFDIRSHTNPYADKRVVTYAVCLNRTVQMTHPNHHFYVSLLTHHAFMFLSETAATRL